MKPIFIFSLPRSGSTLLQRVLAAHPEIATASEPWLLLPYLYSLKDKGVCAEYCHQTMAEGVEDFCEILPRGKESYYAAISELMMRLYRLAGGADVKYFLDKTPRYHLVANEIIKIFPDAKYIFLWRNPLAIAASMMASWAEGRWNLYEYKVDFYKGLKNLVDTYTQNIDSVFSVNFESFIEGPEQKCKEIFDYLELEFDPKVLSGFADVKFKGNLGDSKGSIKYKEISNEPLQKWKKIFVLSPLRKRWAKTYLSYIGEKNLDVMGYNYNDLCDELVSLPSGYKMLLSDMIRMPLFGILNKGWRIWKAGIWRWV